jgi:surface carbohydrate biosynthesis protein
MSNIYFLPIEIKSRELDSKLLIALELAKRGNRVILGEKNKIIHIACEHQCGTYLSKSGAKVDKNNFNQLKQFNHNIAVLDEESIIHQNESAHISSRFGEKSLEMTDRILSWGRYDQSVATKAFPGLHEKIVITGNPRIDLLRKEFRSYFENDVKDLKDKNGSFILIPSSFGMCNHYTESGARIKWRKTMGMISDEKDIMFYKSYADHFTKIFIKFLEDLPKIAQKYYNSKFIVRPHPSENKNVWKNSLSHLDNVKVVSEGNIVPWLISSEMIIHNGCTTAIESFILGKKVISYRPFVNSIYDLEVPNSISMEAFTYNELDQLIANNLKNDPPESYRTNGLNILDNYLSSLKGKFAFEKIVDELETISNNNSRYISPRQIIIKLKRITRDIIFKEERTSYSIQKFPYLFKEEVEKRISQYKRIMFKDSNFCSRKIATNVFFIKSTQ